MIALLYPFIIFTLLLVSALILYKRRYIIGVVLIFSCLLLNYYAKVFSINVTDSSQIGNRSFKVLSFNINGSDYKTDNKIEDLLTFIVSQDADILFLAEDFENVGKKLNTLLIKYYPYTTYGMKSDRNWHYFYSKRPLGSVDHIKIKSNKFSFIFHCYMAYGTDSISFFGCHLASNNYKINEPSIRPESIKGVSSLVEYVKNIELATKQRVEEVTRIIRHPKYNNMTVVMGDFNDVSGSKPLRILVRSGLKDAWWDKGFGYGATISHPLPFRIDHILYGDGLKLKSIQKIDSGKLSDHDALIASFEY